MFRDEVGSRMGFAGEEYLIYVVMVTKTNQI